MEAKGLTYEWNWKIFFVYLIILNDEIVRIAAKYIVKVVYSWNKFDEDRGTLGRVLILLGVLKNSGLTIADMFFPVYGIHLIRLIMSKNQFDFLYVIWIRHRRWDCWVFEIDAHFACIFLKNHTDTDLELYNFVTLFIFVGEFRI